MVTVRTVRGHVHQVDAGVKLNRTADQFKKHPRLTEAAKYLISQIYVYVPDEADREKHITRVLDILEDVEA